MGGSLTIGSLVLKKTLGRFPEVSLAEARAEAARVLDVVRSGSDPRDLERIAKAEAERRRADTFGRLAERFLVDCRQLRSLKEEATLRPVLAEWQDRSLTSIHRRDVIDIIDKVRASCGDYAARKTLAWVRRALNYAMGKALIESSPVSRVEPPARVRARGRVLSDNELRRLWIAAEARPYPFGRYPQLLVFTGARRTELATLRWSDIDLVERSIIVPAERFKTGRPHLIPLSRQAFV
jgi:integrase